MSDLDDPEDAYDATDAPRARLVNFDHRIRWLIEHLADVDMVDVRAALAAHLARLLDDLATLRDEIAP